MRATQWVCVLIGGLSLVPGALRAGTVQIENDILVFRAGNNEVNDIEVDPTAPIGDDTSLGVAVTDRARQTILVGPGCTASGNRAVCQRRSLIALVLGDKNDKASQKFSAQAIPMSIDGGLGDDVIKGSLVPDSIDGGTGNDTIDGDEGDDLLKGGTGDDHITGGRGKDRIFGSSGKDTINALDGESDAIDCGIGIDVLNLFDSTDTRKQCN